MNIYQALDTKSDLPTETVEIYSAFVATQPHGIWFTPSNKEANDRQIADELFDLNLIERKISPVWQNGSFKGNRHQFRITEDLTLISNN
jgi:hypothetical protein